MVVLRPGCRILPDVCRKLPGKSAPQSYDERPPDPLPESCRILPDVADKSATSIIHNPMHLRASCRILPDLAGKSPSILSRRRSVIVDTLNGVNGP